MPTVDSRTAWLPRALGVVGVAVALVTGVAACATSVQGSAEAGSQVARSSPAPSPPVLTESSEPPSSGDPTGGDPSQQAEQACSQLPKDAVTSAFGVQNVTVATDSGTTLAGGILQIKCVVSADNGFRANVVVQVYPNDTLNDANQYLGIMQQKFPSVHVITVPGADVAGTFQQTEDGGAVDEAFAARQDDDNSTVDVVLAGIADSPGIVPKLTAFITALANE